MTEAGNLSAKWWPQVEAKMRKAGVTWEPWFAQARPTFLDNDRLVLQVPDKYWKERIEKHLELLQDVLGEVTGGDAEVQVTVEGMAEGTTEDTAGLDPLSPIGMPMIAPDGQGHLPFGATAGAQGMGSGPLSGTELGLNPRYTFQDFVIGASNRFAHAAAMSVAERPARSYNPLFVYGDSGLGKTHLLQAIAHYVHENYPGSRVRYVSTETFVNEFVDAIRSNATQAFKRRYRDDCDVLLIDDIQFMEGKEGTQAEFFHTFNYLHQFGRQVVISSDRPPKAIATLEDRLRSRFEWGLITDITPPDVETRLAILRQKAERERSAVPPEVLGFIAEHITDNIRQLEGALNRVCAYSGLNREPLTRELAERVLADFLSDNENRPITAKLIIEATAAMFGFPVSDLVGQSRRRPLVTARQVAMYVFRELTDYSYPMIGREFGGRDHTTVMHAVEKITAQMKERRAIYEQVTELIRNIKQG